MHKIFDMPFARVYPLYIKKIERKGRTVAQLHEVITWLTGFNNSQIQRQIIEEKTFREFFDEAKLNSNSSLITGSICGVKIQEIEDPLMLRIRYMDKLVDELAQGRPMAKILRSGM